MDYDPIKGRLARLFLRQPWMKRLMFLLARQVFLRELEVRRALRRLAASGLDPARVLDAGTGYGQYALFLTSCFPACRVISIDIDAARVGQLEDMCRAGSIDTVEAHAADLLEFRLDPPADLILNVDVVEHIEDDALIFRNFAASLNPGGLLLLHTPAMPDEWDEAEILRRTPTVGEHARAGYTRAMLRERLAQAGLDEVWMRSTYGVAGGLAWRLGVRGPMRALAAGLWTLPLVALWMLLVILPVRVLNEIDLRLERAQGGCLLILARKTPAGGL